jgi:tryptophan synthase beta subunit
MLTNPDLTSLSDATDHLDPYGGCFVAGTLIEALQDLETRYSELSANAGFQKELDLDLAHYVGRPWLLYYAERLTKLAHVLIVGSVLIQQIAKHLGDSDKINSPISGILSEMRQAIDAH